MVLVLDAKRRLTVPVSFGPAKPGDHFQAEFNAEDDTLVFRRIATPSDSDWVEVLKQCPVSMDDLPPRRRAPPRRRKL
jgi:hypothetical protein